MKVALRYYAVSWGLLGARVAVVENGKAIPLFWNEGGVWRACIRRCPGDDRKTTVVGGHREQSDQFPARSIATLIASDYHLATATTEPTEKNWEDLFEASLKATAESLQTMLVGIARGHTLIVRDSDLSSMVTWLLDGRSR